MLILFFNFEFNLKLKTGIFVTSYIKENGSIENPKNPEKIYL
jgi:hypothetical protein